MALALHYTINTMRYIYKSVHTVTVSDVAIVRTNTVIIIHNAHTYGASAAHNYRYINILARVLLTLDDLTRLSHIAART